MHWIQRLAYIGIFWKRLITIFSLGVHWKFKLHKMKLPSFPLGLVLHKTTLSAIFIVLYLFLNSFTRRLNIFGYMPEGSYQGSCRIWYAPEDKDFQVFNVLSTLSFERRLEIFGCMYGKACQASPSLWYA